MWVMWKGRFSKPTADLVQRYGESVSYDWRLFRQDIAGSIAHARAQLKAGLLSQEEFSAIESGLKDILKDIEAGSFTWSRELEDVHMNIESELTRRIGAPGAKLHTARSRNDQVATDTRLYCRAEIDEILEKVRHLQRALVMKAKEYADAMMPGYTHLQRAQPVTMGHHLLAYVEMLNRDADRLTDCRRRLNVSPLGSGAIAGSTICLDRRGIAAELGFDAVTENSMDAIADRDYIMETLFDLAVIGAHLSRMSEDVILWCTAEFGFATLSDAHTTGSSLMPQKKNPDVAELTRGKTGRLYGNLTAVMVAVKGLPLTYNRDLQEDKEPLFDSIDTIKLALDVNAEMMAAMTVNTARALEAASDPMLLATDLADYLVRRGVPFRKAHELVGKAVAMSISTGTPLNQLSDEQFASISDAYGTAARDVFELTKAFAQRTNPGAPNSENTRRPHRLLGRHSFQITLPAGSGRNGEPAVRLRGAPPGAGRGRFTPLRRRHSTAAGQHPGSHVQTCSPFLSQDLYQANFSGGPLRGAHRRRGGHPAGDGLCDCMRALPHPGPRHRHRSRLPHFPVQRKQVSDRRSHRRLRHHHHGRAGTVPRVRTAGLHADGGPLSHYPGLLPHGGAYPLHSIPRHHGIYLRHCRGDFLHADQGHLRPHHHGKNPRRLH